MTIHEDLARRAAKRALQLRAERGLSPADPCDIYALIDGLGIDLQFCDIPSLEGIYIDEEESRRICISSHRPPGRQKSTAAHELGHHVFGHGTHVDEVVELGRERGASPEEEVVANTFARVILMPPRAVQASFRLRNLAPERADPQSVYRAACWLGVGYSTLVEHLRWTLGLLGHREFTNLSSASPKNIKSEILGETAEMEVWPLDRHWNGRRLHAQVGDVIVGIRAENGSSQGVVQPFENTANGTLFRAVAPGSIEVPVADGGAVTISVSRRGYVGFYG